MGKYGYFVNAMAVLLTILFDIMCVLKIDPSRGGQISYRVICRFCFPYSLPVTTPTMNYTR